MSEEKSIVKITNYMRSEIVKTRFSEVVGGRNAGAYISSVMLAVADNKDLQECKVESVYVSALRAATLRLSVDPSLGQAYLVPFSGKATLIVGYKGLLDMAVRTGRYRFVNVNPIYDGEYVEENRISGLHTLTGGKLSDKIVGWIAAFEMNNGYSKTMYMTVQEIHAHAKKYSKSYGHSKSGWVTDTQAMERKTVLRLLLRKWGYLDPADINMLETIESETPIIDAEASPDPEHIETPIQEEKKDEAQLMSELGYGNTETPIQKATRIYGELCSRADKVSVPHEPLADNITIEDARKAYKELENYVLGAEEQAKAGE